MYVLIKSFTKVDGTWFSKACSLKSSKLSKATSVKFSHLSVWPNEFFLPLVGSLYFLLKALLVLSIVAAVAPPNATPNAKFFNPFLNSSLNLEDEDLEEVSVVSFLSSFLNSAYLISSEKG